MILYFKPPASKRHQLFSKNNVLRLSPPSFPLTKYHQIHLILYDRQTLGRLMPGNVLQTKPIINLPRDLFATNKIKILRKYLQTRAAFCVLPSKAQEDDNKTIFPLTSLGIIGEGGILWRFLRNPSIRSIL